MMESVFLRPQNDFEELLGTQYFEVTCHPVVRQLRSRDSLILFITKHHFYQNYTILHTTKGELRNYMTTMNISSQQANAYIIQSSITCSKLTVETLEQSVKYVQS